MKKNALAALLIGDSLAQIVERLNPGDGDKLMVLLITPTGVRISTDPGVSRVEALGAVQIAYDLIISQGG